MTHKHTRWFVLGLAVFMLGGLLGIEIAALPSWSAAFSPLFVGKTIAHLAAVGTAWASGKLAPQPGADDARCPACNLPLHTHEEA